MFTQWNERRLRIPAMAACCLAALVLLTLSPVAAQEERTKLVMEEYYLHGDDLDQVTKLGLDKPTFDQEAPTRAEPVRQVALLDDDSADSLSAYWEGDFEGTLSGEMTVTLWAESIGGFTAQLRVFADPDGARTEIGSTLVGIGGGSSPGVHQVTFPVQGQVTSGMRIQVTPVLHMATIRLLYDAVEFPSGFILPTVVPCEEEDTHPDCQ